MTFVLVAAACLVVTLVPYGIGYAVSYGISSVLRAGARVAQVAQVVGSEQVPPAADVATRPGPSCVRVSQQAAPVIHLDRARLLRTRSPK